tara:strand:- start:2113 stop:3114 length:1002 start_codon:yes stop_codon:yes gene_type:complete
MEFTAPKDLGFDETFERFNGKFLDETSYDTVVSSIGVEDDIIKIYKPTGSLFDKPLLACIVKNSYQGDTYHQVKDTLYSIDDTSTMRANAAGPIDHEEMKAKGLIEGKDYVLRTPNSYYPLKKNGEFNRIAEANAIHSVFAGYKRGRFTGMIGLSNWCEKKSNIDKWNTMKKIAVVNEQALKKGCPDIWKLQRTYADECIEEKYHLGGAPITTLSANKYTSEGTAKMSAHIDGKDLEFGMTTMCVFRLGNFGGAYLTFPRYGIAIEADDGDVLIADSNELHGVTKIEGDGIRLSCVAYCSTDVATKGQGGKSEKAIGQHASKYQEKGSLDSFL